jgi:hypothetical protein
MFGGFSKDRAESRRWLTSCFLLLLHSPCGFAQPGADKTQRGQGSLPGFTRRRSACYCFSPWRFPLAAVAVEVEQEAEGVGEGEEAVGVAVVVGRSRA